MLVLVAYDYHMLGIISALLFYTVFICFLCMAANRHNKTLSDYVLGDRHLRAPITALGAGFNLSSTE